MNDEVIGSLFTIMSPDEIDCTKIKFQEMKRFKRLYNNKDISYLLCFGIKSENKIICAYVYNKTNSNGNAENEYENLWVSKKQFVTIRITFLKDTKLKIKDIPLLNRLSREYELLREKSIEAQEKSKEDKMMKKRIYSTRKRKTRAQIYAEREIRKTAMNDPRYYADEGIVDICNGPVSKYKTYSKSDWKNIKNPILSGRGNF